MVVIVFGYIQLAATMVILHKLYFFMWRGYSFDDVCSMDVKAQNLTQCWMNHEDHVNNPKCLRYS